MAIRYFNLKQGDRKVQGGVIKVDTSKKRLEKLVDFSGDFHGTGYNFEFLKSEADCNVYEFSIPNEKIINSSEGIPVPVETGSPDKIELKLNSKGELSLSKFEKIIYLTEISEAEAEKIRTDAENWALQRAYIYE